MEGGDGGEEGRGAYYVDAEKQRLLTLWEESSVVNGFFVCLLFPFLSLQIKDDIERFKSQGVEMEEKRKTILRGLEVREERGEMGEGGRGGRER